MTPSTFYELHIYANNGTTPDSSLVTANPFNVNQWYHLRGEIQGNVAKLYLNGDLLVTWTNSKVDLANGKIGLSTYKTSASFDNVHFYPPTALAVSGSYEAKYLTVNTLSDANGMARRYTFDNFGRLKTATDAFGNLFQDLNYYFSVQGTSPFDPNNPNYVKTTLATNAVHHMRNHDFENGSGSLPDSWNKAEYGSGVGTWDNTAGVSGTKSLKAYIPTASASNRVRWDSWYDEKISPKKTYRMEVWVKTDATYNGLAAFTLWVHDVNHNYLAAETRKMYLPNTGNLWKKYTLDFTPGANADHVYAIYLDFEYNGVGTVWYDRANFYELNATKNFVDGLGRDIQNLQYEGYNRSTQRATLYDLFNRVSKATKAFYSADTNFTLAYNTTTQTYPTLDSANTYYSGNHPAYYPTAEYDTSPYAYSETAYLADPLNRPQKLAAPGTAFRMGTGKEVKFDYLINAGGEVQGYNANLLLKQRQTDENGNIVDTFADKFGNTVGTTVDPGTSPALNYKTKFEYDVLGNLLKSKAPKGDSTTYFFNTLSQLRQKTSQDAGTIDYLYDQNGNLRFVKDAKGTGASPAYFIYYKYDNFNRKLEEGKMLVGSPGKFTQANADNTTFPTPADTVKVKYQYDATTYTAGATQRNLRGHLDAIEYVDDRWLPTVVKGYIFYSYDNNGNVEWIEQDIPKSNVSDGNGYIVTMTHYSYDALGKVTKIYFHRTFPPGGSTDAFYVWYDYNALGRLEKVFSATTDLKPTTPNAQYLYWPGGQVRRLVLGNTLQGLDYLYNSRDWLTQINHQSLLAGKDFGNDTTNTTGAQTDRFGEIIGYNLQKHIALDSDYTPDFAAQFNGSISWLTANTKDNTNPASLTGWMFKYDKANRLTPSNWGYNNSNPPTGTNWLASTKYDLPSLAYDQNGNLSTMTRNDQNGAATNMTYNYYSGYKNRLEYIAGLPGHTSLNYVYDANGNMTQDKSKLGSSSVIYYDYRNLPIRIPKSTTPSGTIYFGYDGKGQRVSKNNLFYVPGADGKVIAVYDVNGTLLYWNIWGLDLIGQRFWKQ